MELGRFVRGIQVDRDSEQLWALNIRRSGDGDPPLPPGNNTLFDLDYFTINKTTGAITNLGRSHGINMGTFAPKLGYWAQPNTSVITTQLDTSSLMEDRANLSIVENLGIAPPPRGENDEPLEVDGYTPFNPQNLTFPSNIDLVVSSNYRSINTGGGESTRSAMAYEQLTHESSIDIPVRIIISDKTATR